MLREKNDPPIRIEGRFGSRVLVSRHPEKEAVSFGGLALACAETRLSLLFYWRSRGYEGQQQKELSVLNSSK